MHTSTQNRFPLHLPGRSEDTLTNTFADAAAMRTCKCAPAAAPRLSASAPPSRQLGSATTKNLIGESELGIQKKHTRIVELLLNSQALQERHMVKTLCPAIPAKERKCPQAHQKKTRCADAARALLSQAPSQ